MLRRSYPYGSNREPSIRKTRCSRVEYSSCRKCWFFWSCLGGPSPPATTRAIVFHAGAVSRPVHGGTSWTPTGRSLPIPTRLRPKRDMAISLKCSTAGKTEPSFVGRSASAISSRCPNDRAHIALAAFNDDGSASRRPGLIVAGGLRTAAAGQRRTGRAIGSRRPGQVRQMRLLPLARGVFLVGRRHVDGVVQPAMP